MTPAEAGNRKSDGEEFSALSERLFEFSLRVVRLCDKMMEKPGVGRTLGPQLLRCGNSVAANYEESQAAQSRPDFISEVNISLKEAREANYWLRIITASKLFTKFHLEESRQIKSILGSII